MPVRAECAQTKPDLKRNPSRLVLHEGDVLNTTAPVKQQMAFRIDGKEVPTHSVPAQITSVHASSARQTLMHAVFWHPASCMTPLARFTDDIDADAQHHTHNHAQVTEKEYNSRVQGVRQRAVTEPWIADSVHPTPSICVCLSACLVSSSACVHYSNAGAQKRKHLETDSLHTDIFPRCLKSFSWPWVSGAPGDP